MRSRDVFWLRLIEASSLSTIRRMLFPAAVNLLADWCLCSSLQMVHDD